MAILRGIALEDRDADDRWEKIGEIARDIDGSTIDIILALTRSASVNERVLGLDILGQVGAPGRYPFSEQALPVLITAADDDEAEARNAAIISLGHIADNRALQAILHNVNHPSDNVRFAVAVALPRVAGDPASAEAIAALIVLSADPDSEIRDWATMGLGSQMPDTDSPTIRDALFARLEDHEHDTADEALLGLALRHNARIIPVLLERLNDDPGNLAVDAAAQLGSRAMLPALLRLKSSGGQDNNPSAAVLDRAILASSY